MNLISFLTVMPPSKGPIDLRHFVIENLLGSGAYGKVYMVKKLGGVDKNAIYAMKVIRKSALTRQKTIEHINTERRVLERIRGIPFVIQMHYAFQDELNLYLVMDYASGGELFGQLQQLISHENVVCFYAAEILLALEHLHNNKIIYRDIKLENILLDSKGHIVLADLGLARFFGERPEDWTVMEFLSFSFCGTVEYMSPEILESKGHTFSTDLWSLGVLLYEMLTGTSPYALESGDNNAPAMLQRIRLRSIDKATLSSAAYDLITKLLVIDRSKRMTICDAKKHEFFANIDWTALSARQMTPPIRPYISGPEDVSNFPREFTKQRGFQMERSARSNDSNNNLQLPLNAFPQYDFTAPNLKPATQPDANLTQAHKSVHPKIVSTLSDVTLEQFENSLPDLFNDYRTENLISVGQFSKCYTIKPRNGTEERKLCVKILRRRLGFNRFLQENFDPSMNEIRLLQKCVSCSFIVHFEKQFFHNGFLFLVTEFANGGTVFQRQQRSELSWEQIWAIARSIAMAINFLHGRNIGHFDIKENNIFIKKNPNGTEDYMLGDFGFAYEFSNQYSLINRPWCSPANAAPEVLIQGVRVYEGEVMASLYQKNCDDLVMNGYGLQADIWSFGTVLYSLITGQSPLSLLYERENLKFSDYLDKIRSGVFNQNLETLSPKLRDFLNNLLEIHPYKRMSIAHVMYHIWSMPSQGQIRTRPAPEINLEAVKKVVQNRQAITLTQTKPKVISLLVRDVPVVKPQPMKTRKRNLQVETNVQTITTKMSTRAKKRKVQ